MTESETTTAAAFVATLAEYRIALTDAEASQITRQLLKWREAMGWINSLESFLGFGKSLPAAPSSLRRYLTGDQLAGKREAFLPVRTVIKPLPAQKGFDFGD